MKFLAVLALFGLICAVSAVTKEELVKRARDLEVRLEFEIRRLRFSHPNVAKVFEAQDRALKILSHELRSAHSPQLVANLGARLQHLERIVENELKRLEGRTGFPSPRPIASPSPRPTASPSPRPTASPSPRPTASSSPRPTASSSTRPTASSSPRPTASPSTRPTASPSPRPTASPSPRPTASPSPRPTASSSTRPTASPSPRPTASPSPRPTASPSPRPTASSSPRPTASPSPRPTASSSPRPTASPSPRPTASPSPRPTASSSPRPTASLNTEPTKTSTKTTKTHTRHTPSPNEMKGELMKKAIELENNANSEIAKLKKNNKTSLAKALQSLELEVKEVAAKLQKTTDTEILELIESELYWLERRLAIETEALVQQEKRIEKLLAIAVALKARIDSSKKLLDNTLVGKALEFEAKNLEKLSKGLKNAKNEISIINSEIELALIEKRVNDELRPIGVPTTKKY